MSSYPSILDFNTTEIEPGTLPDFILYLEKRLNINGLDKDKLNIEEIKKSKILKIRSNKTTLFLKLDEEKKKAILYQQNNTKKEIIFNFDLEKVDDIYIITEFTTSTIEEKIISYQPIIERDVQENHLPELLLGFLQNNFRRYNNNLTLTKEDEQSYILLANNPKFMRWLEKIKYNFDSQYYLFKSMTDNISIYKTEKR